MPLLNPVQSTRIEGEPWVFVDPDHVAPRRFTATVHHVGGKLRRGEVPRDGRLGGAGGVHGFGGVQVALEIELQHGGVPRCLALEVRPQPPENEPLTTTTVRRIPLDRVMRVAVTDAMRELPPEGGEWVFSPGVEEREDFHADYRQGSRRPRSRFEAEEVARVYRDALNVSGRARPTEAVMIEFGIGRSTAGHWVTRARAEGALGPAKRGAAGG